MTGLEWLALLSQALLKGAFAQIGKRGVDGLLDWAKEEAAKRNLPFTSEDRKQLEHLLRDDSKWDAVISQFRPVARRGVAIVGPSGVGKTSLYNFLTGKTVLTPAYSTPERTSGRLRIGAQQVAVVDTPGSHVQVNLSRETFEYISKGKVSILLILLAAGFLDTIGVPGLSRPGLASQQEPTLEKYLEKTKQEEIAWLHDLVSETPDVKARIPYCMVVLNKADQWALSKDEVLKYYQQGKGREAIDAVVRKFCRTDTQPSFHVVATTYNSFKGTAPVAEWSAEAALLSLAILRAEIRRRWKEL